MLILNVQFATFYAVAQGVRHQVSKKKKRRSAIADELNYALFRLDANMF